ncbi:unnamed protein product [Periconia digitata]|uniref:Uncharacterized protein n=1 Tax=Periconia digitata TaxID=1303443 RepID=A0A9W4U788_9PLEO|nr:unnamed protein product [Periconia digitata]
MRASLTFPQAATLCATQHTRMHHQTRTLAVKNHFAQNQTHGVASPNESLYLSQDVRALTSQGALPNETSTGTNAKSVVDSSDLYKYPSLSVMCSTLKNSDPNVHAEAQCHFW